MYTVHFAQLANFAFVVACCFALYFSSLSFRCFPTANHISFRRLHEEFYSMSALLISSLLLRNEPKIYVRTLQLLTFSV